jgi:hypothetical protein
MDRDELLIGLGELVLSVVTYFAGVLRTERRHARPDREASVALLRSKGG